jgi:hypothetical protein
MTDTSAAADARAATVKEKNVWGRFDMVFILETRPYQKSTPGRQSQSDRPPFTGVLATRSTPQ